MPKKPVLAQTKGTKIKTLDQSTINKRTEKRKNAKNYLNNADLLKELKKSREQNKMTDELAKMFMVLAQKYAGKGRFINYTYNDDLQGFALLTGVKVWRSFDPEKGSNPFAYFTQVFKAAFLQYDNSERRQRDIRDAKLVSLGANPSYSYSDRYGNDDFDHHLHNDMGFGYDTEGDSAEVGVTDSPTEGEETEY
jgi:hypothetical protein